MTCTASAFAERREKMRAKCIEKCGRAEDLRVADIAKLFPWRGKKTVANDVGERLPVAMYYGRIPTFSDKEATIYLINLENLERTYGI